MRGLLCLLLVATPALADTKQDLEDAMHVLGDGNAELPDDAKPPKFAITTFDATVGAKKLDDVRPNRVEYGWWSERVVVGEAADKKSAWIAADVGEGELGCGADPCPPPKPLVPDYHVTILFDKVKGRWDYVAWHIAFPVDAKKQTKAMEAGKTPAAITRGIAAGAEDAVKLFEASIGDPKALAASVSVRKDVVLYGSELKERTVGGDKVKAKLAAWKLAFKVRDGVQAGVTASKTVAWVAANVDATSTKKPKDKAVPYRVLFLYEKTGSTWQLVQAHFSFRA